MFVFVSCGGGGGNGDELEPCGPGGTCPVGFECNPVDNLCYEAGTIPHPDAAPQTKPDTAITLKPAAVSNSSAVEISFSSDVSGATFVCSLDGGSFEPCTSPFTATVIEGTHTFAVAAVSGTMQDDTPETWTWTVDLTPPDTTITAGTAGNVNNSEATFTFTSTEDSTFECAFDDAGFSACTSDQVFTGFGMGTHSFAVRAIDAAGNPDASPATQSWTVDQTSPQTSIDSGPDALTNDTAASFTFSSDKPSSTFTCKRDDGAAGLCTSPQTYSGLSEGEHTFSVFATDAASNPDPSPATFTWTIDTTAPTVTINSGPGAGTTTGPSVSFTFSSPENTGQATPPISFECQMDSGAVAACTSPKAYAALGSGSHTFKVRGRDRADNPSGFVTRTWTVDASRPTVSITSPANGALTRGAGTIVFSGSEAGMTFACTLDGTAVTPCVSPVAFSFTTDASHTFSVTGSARGLTSTPATTTWRADGVKPVVTISSPAAGATTGPSVSVMFSAEAGSSFECKVGNGSFDDCTSPLALLLPGGAASVTIHATDAAGNLSTDVTRSWTVDASGPTVNVSVTPLVNGRTRSNGQVAYSSPEGGVTFRCRTYLSTATPPPFAACAATPFTLSGFSNGNVVKIDVEGRDGFNNPTVSSTTVTIDAQGPQITITAPSGRIGASGTVTFTYDSGVDNTGSFTCAVSDPAGTTIASGPCSPAAGLAFTATASGSYTARVNGTDGLGNTSSRTQTFTVDVTGPTVKLGTCRQSQPDDPIVCDVTNVGSDAQSLQCQVVGLTSFGGCGSSLTSVSITGAAVGANVIEVRAVDDLGNVGAVDTRTVTVAYNGGHGVLIGHDYTTVTADTRQLLVNAANLSYVKQLGLNRHPKVLMWCFTPSCDANEERNVKDVLGGAGIVANDIKTFSDEPRDLTDALVGRDILLIVDQNATRQDLVGIGKNWTDSMIGNFAGRGGTVIVLDGVALNGDTPSRTFEVLVGPGAYSGDIVNGTITGQKVIYGAADTQLQGGVIDGYDAPTFTVGFIRSDDRWTRSFVINFDIHVVLHRTF